MGNLDEYVYPTHVKASFDNRAHAEKAYDQLSYLGYKTEDIHVLFTENQNEVHARR